jgi:hypothetical protein
MLPPRPRSIVVLGMHRSGTSVLTRVINLLGVPLCRADDVYSAPDNPTGHWESRSLVAFNERLLGAFGGTPAAPPLMAEGWERHPAAVALQAEGRAVFGHAHPTPTWVWKDPRTCLTLPFWRSVWPDAPIAVFVHRAPLEVAQSLLRRDGFGKAHCVALWERYIRSALRGAHGLPWVTVRFDDLMADPAAAVLELRDHLVRLGVPTLADGAEAARFVAPTQAASRHLGPGLAVDSDATDRQLSLLAAINALPRSTARFAAPEVGAESASTTELLSAMRDRDHPMFRVAAKELLPAFRRTAVRRLQHRFAAR